MENFIHGTPSVYDLANFAVSVILLFVCSGMHLRQIRNKKTIDDLQAQISKASAK